MRWLPLISLIALSFPIQAEEFPVASGLGFSPAPVVTAGSGEVLVVWQDDGRVMGRRFGLDGMPRDAAPLKIAAADTTSISVAFDGLRYLVAWAGLIDDTRARVSAAFVSDRVSEPVVLMERERQGSLAARVAVAWNGVDFIAVWADSVQENDAFVRAASISAGGRMGPAVDIAGPFRFVDGVDVTAGPDRELIVYAARTAAFEAILDAQLIDRNLVSHERRRLVAWQGSNWGCLGGVAVIDPSALWAGAEWAVSFTASSCRFGNSVAAARLSASAEVLGRREITPAQRANTRTELVMAAGEPVVLTQITPDIIGAPVDLHRLWRNEPPRRLTGNLGMFSAASDGDRIAIVHENPYIAASAGWRVDGRVLRVDFPPAPRRRAVR
jgi:hypothetical protein